ncbi:MAG: glycoside hydrolase family protein [Advenella sp.]|uniref:glycoside hydrolase family protein n=1 Tax=Advenella sp. TaxID=1872388 RepID=UPI003F985BAA
MRSCCKGRHRPPAQGGLNTLVSFVFNVGEPQFSTSTLQRLLNAEIYIGASIEFER